MLDWGGRPRFLGAYAVAMASDLEPRVDFEAIARAFESKSRDTIISALQTMMWIQTQRLQMGLAVEREDGVLNSKVSALMNSMFSNAIKIAKIVDPRATDQMQINLGVQVNNNGNAEITSNALVARAFNELRAIGLSHEEITPELVEQHIAGQLMAAPPTEFHYDVAPED
jgi:hypothetical protein